MKRLHLSTSDKKISGLCGGIGEYLDVDSTIVRLVMVVLAAMTGFIPLLIAYVIAWIIVPKAPAKPAGQA